MASHWNFIRVSRIPSQFFFYCLLYIFNFDCFQVLKLGNCAVTVQTPCISLCSKFLCGQKQQVLYVIKYGHILSNIPCLPEINLQLSSIVWCSWPRSQKGITFQSGDTVGHAVPEFISSGFLLENVKYRKCCKIMGI